MATQIDRGNDPGSVELQNFSSMEPRTESEKISTVEDPESVRAEATPPNTAFEARPTWNSPRINMWRVFATFWSFFIVGLNDGAYGVGSISLIME